MNNIQRAFRDKSALGLRMAQGGIVPDDRGVLEKGAAFVNQMTHGGQLSPTQAPLGDGLAGGAASALSGREQQINDAVAAQTGMATGGIVHGKGTATSDSVPVNLSAGEGVLPVKTVDAIGGPPAVHALIQRTTGNTPHAGLRAGGHYAAGAAPLDPTQPPAAQPAQPAPPAPGAALPGMNWAHPIDSMNARFAAQNAQDPQGAARAMATDTPYDVATPVTPFTGGISKGLGAAGDFLTGTGGVGYKPGVTPGVNLSTGAVVDAAKNFGGKALDIAGQGVDAVKGLAGRFGSKAGAPAADAAPSMANNAMHVFPDGSQSTAAEMSMAAGRPTSNLPAVANAANAANAPFVKSGLSPRGMLSQGAAANGSTFVSAPAMTAAAKAPPAPAAAAAAAAAPETNFSAREMQGAIPGSNPNASIVEYAPGSAGAATARGLSRATSVQSGAGNYVPGQLGSSTLNSNLATGPSSGPLVTPANGTGYISDNHGRSAMIRNPDSASGSGGGLNGQSNDPVVSAMANYKAAALSGDPGLQRVARMGVDAAVQSRSQDMSYAGNQLQRQMSMMNYQRELTNDRATAAGKAFDDQWGSAATDSDKNPNMARRAAAVGMQQALAGMTVNTGTANERPAVLGDLSNAQLANIKDEQDTLNKDNANKNEWGPKLINFVHGIKLQNDTNPRSVETPIGAENAHGVTGAAYARDANNNLVPITGSGPFNTDPASASEMRARNSGMRRQAEQNIYDSVAKTGRPQN